MKQEKKPEEKYQFLQAVHIKPAGGHPGKDFPLGIHSVPEHFEYDPYFMKLVGAGLIVEASSKHISPQTSEERAHALLEKLAKKSSTHRTAAHAVKPPLSEAQKATQVAGRAQVSAEAQREGTSGVQPNLVDGEETEPAQLTPEAASAAKGAKAVEEVEPGDDDMDADKADKKKLKKADDDKHAGKHPKK